MSADRSPPPLTSLRRCLEGEVPATVSTCAADGTPNVSFVSSVDLVDAHHVALSHQFFNKTRANLQANPHACALVVDPDTGGMYRIRMRYEGEETSGPLFERMSLRIDAIASQTGMERIFRLLAADVFEVLEIEAIPMATGQAPPAAETAEALDLRELAGLRTVSERINRAGDLEGVLGAVLETVEAVFGFGHAMVLLLDETGQRLFAVAMRGYPRSGIGAEVALGEGIIGTAARARRLLRVSGVERELRYARVVREQAAEAGAPCGAEIPLPGLADVHTQIAIPLVVGEDLVGVLAAESPRPIDIGAAAEAFLAIVADHVALALQRMITRPETVDAAPATAAARPPSPPEPGSAPDSAPERRLRFAFYPADDCVFVDDEYLIRNVPGRILWKLLNARVHEGRQHFCNRELRLDPSLGLPEIKDNLESRLILLRNRLELKCPEVRLVRTGRGRFSLELDSPVELLER